MGNFRWFLGLWCGAAVAHRGQNGKATCGRKRWFQPSAGRLAGGGSLAQTRSTTETKSGSTQNVTKETGDVFTQKQVVKCFQEETERERAQGILEGVFGAMNVAFPGYGEAAGGLTTMVFAQVNAEADNCLEKGFEAVLSNMEDMSGVLEGLATSVSENHRQVLAGQGLLMKAFSTGVEQLEDRLMHMLHRTNSFQASVEEGIGRLDQEITGVVRNQNALSQQLDQLSLQLYGTEQRLLAEQYSKSAVSVVAAAKVITGALEDIQDNMAQVYDHRARLPTLVLNGSRARLNAVKWASTEKQQMTQLKEVARQAWTRAKDAFSSMAATLSEGNFLRGYFMQSLRISADRYVKSAQSQGQCGNIIYSMQPLLTQMGNDVLTESNRLMNVIVGTVVQVHDIFKNMVLVFGRHGVSPVQYRDSLTIIKHAFKQIEVDFSDNDRLLSLVQDMISPVLTVHCPLSPSCRKSAFEANNIGMTGRGVQIDELMIAFEPLSHIGHRNKYSGFFICHELPLVTGAWIKIEGGSPATPENTFNSNACTSDRFKHATDRAQTRWMPSVLECPDDYVLRKFPGKKVKQVELKCYSDIEGKEEHDESHFWGEFSEVWRIRYDGKSMNTLERAQFECELPGSVAKILPDSQRTRDEADTLVDIHYKGWSLGGNAWHSATSRMRKTLDAAIEDSGRRLFLISNQEHCAETLPHGLFAGVSATPLWDRQKPYFCRDCAPEPHEQWTQEVTVDGHHERNFRLDWKFNERLTLQERLTKAMEPDGIDVVWDVFTSSKQSRNVKGKFFFNFQGGSAAVQNINGFPFRIRPGLWFGHGSHNMGGGACNTLWFDRNRYNDQVFTSRMYVVY